MGVGEGVGWSQDAAPDTQLVARAGAALAALEDPLARDFDLGGARVVRDPGGAGAQVHVLALRGASALRSGSVRFVGSELADVTITVLSQQSALVYRAGPGEPLAPVVPQAHSDACELCKEQATVGLTLFGEAAEHAPVWIASWAPWLRGVLKVLLHFGVQGGARQVGTFACVIRWKECGNGLHCEAVAPVAGDPAGAQLHYTVPAFHPEQEEPVRLWVEAPGGDGSAATGLVLERASAPAGAPGEDVAAVWRWHGDGGEALELVYWRERRLTLTHVQAGSEVAGEVEVACF